MSSIDWSKYGKPVGQQKQQPQQPAQPKTPSGFNFVATVGSQQSAPQQGISGLLNFLKNAASNVGPNLKQFLQPSLAKFNQQRVNEIFPGTQQAVQQTAQNIQKNPLNLPQNQDLLSFSPTQKLDYLKSLVQPTVSGITHSAGETKQNVANLLNMYIHPEQTTNAQKTAIGLNVPLSLAKLGLNVASAPFQVAGQLPGIGNAVKLAGIPFSAAGETGAQVGVGGLNALPLSSQTKQTLTPVARDIGTLTGQLALGAFLKNLKSKPEQQSNISPVDQAVADNTLQDQLQQIKLKDELNQSDLPGMQQNLLEEVQQSQRTPSIQDKLAQVMAQNNAGSPEAMQQIINDPTSTPEQIANATARLSELQNVQARDQVANTSQLDQQFAQQHPDIAGANAENSAQAPVADNQLSSNEKLNNLFSQRPTGDRVERSFNSAAYENINLKPEDQAVVQQKFEALGLDTRGVKTFADMRAGANELGISPDELFNATDKRLLSAEQVTGLKDFINQQRGIERDTATQLADTSLSQADKLDLQQTLNDASNNINKGLKRLAIGNTELGRAVVANKIFAEDTMQPEAWYARAQDQLGNKEFTPEIRSTIDDMISQDNKPGLANYISSLKDSSLSQKVVTLYKAGLYGNPASQVAISLHNAAMFTLEELKRYPATALDWMLEKATGERTTTVSPQIYSAEIGALPDAAQEVAQTMKYGVTERQVLEGYDFNHAANFDNPFLQAYTQTVMRSLSAQHAMTYDPSYAGSIAEQAIVSGLNEGLKGSELTDYIKEYQTHPPQEAIDMADNAAKFTSFKSSQNRIVKAINQEANSGSPVGTGIDVIAPTRSIPINIAKGFFDYSPFGAMKTVYNAISDAFQGVPFDQHAFANGIARPITGLPVTMLGLYLASKGLATGNAPSDPKQKAQWDLQKKQPNSVLINGHWVNTIRLGIPGLLLSLGSEIQDVIQNHQNNSLSSYIEDAASLIDQPLSTFANQPLVKGMYDVSRAVIDPGHYGQSLFDNLAVSLVPTVVKSFGYGTDKYQRDATTLIDKIKSRIPGLSETLQPKIDILGRPVENQNNIFGNKFNPTQNTLTRLFAPTTITTPDTTKAVQILKDANYIPSVPDAKVTVQAKNSKKNISRKEITLQGIDLTNYLTDIGNATQDVIIKTANQPGYGDLDQQQKVDLLTKNVNKARADVNTQWATKAPATMSAITKKTYEHSKDAPNNPLQVVETYGLGVLKDPADTLKAFFSGQPVRKVVNDATIVERQNFLDTLSGGNKSKVVDHIIPLSLGGTNDQSNLQVEDKTEAAQKDKVEIYLEKLLKKGLIGRKQAQTRIKNWRTELVNVR